MKKMLLVIIACTFCSVTMAQSNQEEKDLIQSVFGMEKKAIVADFIQLDGAKGDAFWSLYDEYEAKRKELGSKRIDLLEKYANSYTSLDETTTADLLNETISLQSSNDKLIASYAKKIKKEVDVKTAAQFYQIEGYFLSRIRAELLENIPLIGALD